MADRDAAEPGDWERVWIEADELSVLDDRDTVIENGGNATLIRCRHAGRERLFKKFHEDHLADVDPHALRSLVSWRLTLPVPIRQRLDRFTAWPRYLVGRHGNLQGLLVPVAPDRFFRRTPNGLHTPRTCYDLLPSGRYVAAPLAEKLAVSAHAVQVVLWLHDQGVIVDDLQPDNILCARAGTGVYLVDCDSMVAPGVWGRVAHAVAPDIMAVVVGTGGPPGPHTDLAKLTWVLLRILLDQPGLTRVGARERAQLAALVSAETATFLVAALDRAHRPEDWLQMAGSWRAVSRGAAESREEPELNRLRRDSSTAWRAPTRSAAWVYRPSWWLPGRLDYRPAPAPPLFPRRYSADATRSWRRWTIPLLIGAVLLMIVIVTAIVIDHPVRQGGLLR